MDNLGDLFGWRKAPTDRISVLPHPCSFAALGKGLPFSASCVDTFGWPIIELSFWNYTADTALGIFHIALVTGNNVDVQMINGLAGPFANVDADIVAVRFMFDIDDGLAR